MAAITLATGKNAGITSWQGYLAVLFPLFTVVALGIDSVHFSKLYFDGRLPANILVLSYFAILYVACSSYLRMLMLVMLPLSYLGEILFCKLLGMYAYRTDAIPLYVPFGHAVVYVSGYVLAHTPFALRHDKRFRIFFAIAFTALFLYAGFILNDVLSVIMGSLFFVILYKKRWQNMYYFIALCVIFIELTGTCYKCWTWVPQVFGYIPTANPPMGAVFIYAGGDVLLAKIAALWQKRKLR